MAAVLYGRGQRDAGGVHKLEPERHNSGAAREAGGAEYLLAAGHRCLQRRAGGDYLLEPSQMDGRADRQSGLQYKLVAVADRGTDSGAGGENLLSGTADYPRRSRGAAVVDRLCSPAQRGADGPGAGKNLLLAGAIYRGADCRTGKLKRLVATARDLGAGRLALDALKAFDFGADRRTAGTDKRKAAAADRRQAVDAGYDLLHAAAHDDRANGLAAADIDETAVDGAADLAAREHVQRAAGINDDTGAGLARCDVECLTAGDCRHGGAPASRAVALPDPRTSAGAGT